MAKDSNLMVSKNGILYVLPLEDIEIHWENVSEAFKKTFCEFHLYAQDDLVSDETVNYGLNSLSVLEKIVYMINNELVDADSSFNDLWMQATETLLDDLEIA